MSRNLSTEYLQEINKIHGDDPLVTLYDVTLDSSTVQRYIAYSEGQTYDSNSYTPWPIARQEIVEEVGGTINTLKISVSNVTRAAQSWLEDNDLIGNLVVIRILPLSLVSSIDEDDVIAYEWAIIGAVADDANVTFELGQADITGSVIPRRRLLRTRCRYVYRDSTTCNYPSDRFGGDSDQDLLTGGDGAKLAGWTVHKTDRSTAWDINQTNAGEVTCTTANSGGFLDASTDAPVMWKGTSGEFTTGFDFWAEVVDLTDPVHTPGAGFNIASLLAWDLGDPSVWQAYWIQRQESNNYFWHVRWSTSGKSTSTTVRSTGSLDQPFIRMTHDGSGIMGFYAKANESDAWGTELYENTTGSPLTNFTLHPANVDTLRLGLMFWSTADSNQTQRVAQWIVSSGGFASCDFGLSTENGCVAHNNTHRYGGTPRILRV